MFDYWKLVAKNIEKRKRQLKQRIADVISIAHNLQSLCEQNAEKQENGIKSKNTVWQCQQRMVKCQIPNRRAAKWERNLMWTSVRRQSQQMKCSLCHTLALRHLTINEKKKIVYVKVVQIWLLSKMFINI